MSKTFFRRLAVILPLALGLQFIMRELVDLPPEAGAVGSYVVAVGTLYSVLTAFTIVSVWLEFKDTDRAIQREALGLQQLWRYVGYVNDPSGVVRARRAIQRYRDEVISREWPAMARGERATEADDEFREISDVVHSMNATAARDVAAWTEAVRTFVALSDARTDRRLLVFLRMPTILRLLLYVATASLLAGIILLSFQSLIVGALIIAFTVIVSLMVLEVIDDMDNPFGGSWTISTEAFERTQFDSEQEAIARETSEQSPEGVEIGKATNLRG